LLDRVAIVVRGVVHQDVEAAEILDQPRDPGLGAGHVGQVDMLIDRRLPQAGEAGDQRLRLRIGDIEEGDVAALADKALDHAGADARSAAGDQHALALQARIEGALIASERHVHGISFRHENKVPWNSV
jgi:hypothetical protein